MTLRQKIILFLILPLLVTLSIFFVFYQQQQTKIINSELCLSDFQMVNQYVELTPLLAEERGLTITLTTTPSASNRLRLKNLQHKIDQKIKALPKSLNSHNPLNADLMKANSYLKTLKFYRHYFQQQNTKIFALPLENKIFYYYNQLNKILIKLPIRLLEVHSSHNNPQVRSWHQLNSLLNIIGQERALIYHSLAKQTLSLDNFKQLVQLIDRENQINLQNQTFINPSEIEKLSTQVNNIKQEFISRGPQNFQTKTPNIQPQIWWDLSTQYIQTLNKTTLATSVKINKQLQQHITQARKYQAKLLLGFILFSLLAFFIGYKLAKHINKGLNSMIYNIQAFKHNQPIKDLIYLNDEDELGHVNNAFNRLAVQHLLKLEVMKRFKTIFTEMDQMVIILDKRHNILEVNKRFEDITDFSKHEVIGKPPFTYQTTNQTRRFYQKIRKAILTEGHTTDILWDRNKAGKDYPIEFSISTIKANNGKILNYIIVARDISRRVQNEEKIWQQANTDTLTNLYNRGYFLNQLKIEIELSQRHSTQFALLFLDLDGFKLVNDTLGHSIGDELLIQTTKIFPKILRKTDLVARLGGDEFVILLKRISSFAQVEKIAQLLLNAIKQPLNIKEHPISISASVGISLYPQDANEAETLMQYADTAMYEAKNAGKNAFRFHQPGMQTHIQHLMSIHHDLKAGIPRNELVLYYQPVIDFKTQQVVGAEILVRWQHPTKGLLFPDIFIPVAEQMGDISDLGEWVLNESFRQGQIWQAGKLFKRAFYLSVNVAAEQLLKHFDILNRQLNHIMQTCQIKNQPNFIQLEMTESTLINDNDKLIEQLNSIHQLGFDFLLDDFGTGYSSLSYLKKFPISKLKIDQSFVREMDKNSEDKALVEATMAMAKALSLTVVAEGVETTKHADILSYLNCDLAQGYLYAKPLPATEFEDFVKNFNQSI